MKIEYLDDISEGGRYTNVVSDKLIRLYDFDSVQARKLRDLIKKAILDEGVSIDLSSVDFIRPVNCNLVLQIANANKGIATNDNYNFVCSLTIENYKEMIANIEPFCEPGSGDYQWLYDIDCPIDFLFSPGGTW
jgi:hypothetical protein